LANDSSPKPLFPGQIERLTFTLEHVRALASPVRALIFWCFNPYEPMSVSDIAKEIGKSAQTVRYHVNALLELDLILVVDERKRRSRTENLYVRKAVESLDSGAEGTREYNRYRARGLALEARKMTRETAGYYGVLESDPSVVAYSLLRKTHLKLNVEQARKLRQGISQLFREATQNQTSREDGGVQVNLFMYIMPTAHQSELWAESLGITIPMDELPDDFEEDSPGEE